MGFKIGDKVRVQDERKARDAGVWEKIGEVTAIVDDGTAVKRISVSFPDSEPIIGAVAGMFELA